MEALYCMSAICFLIGLICLFLSLWSRDPKHLGSAVGTLANSKKVMRRAYRYSDKKSASPPASTAIRSTAKPTACGTTADSDAALYCDG